jgi:hypothetical protein
MRKLAVGSAVTVGATAVHKSIKHSGEKIKPNEFLRTAGFASSIASGAIGAATVFGGGWKKAAISTAITTGIDVGSVALNAAAYSGKGQLKQRIKEGAKQEAINMAAGNAVFIGGLLANKQSRQAMIKTASNTLGFLRRHVTKLRGLL